MIYESAKDRARQVEFSKTLLEQFGLSAINRETLSRHDLEIYRGDCLIGVSEFKWRETRYDTLRIDQSKIHHLQARGVAAGVVSALFIEWDGIGYMGHIVLPDHWYAPCVLKRTKARGIPGETPELEDLAYDIPTDLFCPAQDIVTLMVLLDWSRSYGNGKRL